MKNLTLQLRLASLLSLILLACTAAYGQLTPSGDSYTNSAAATTNYGSKTTLDVESTQTTFIQFDLSSIPSGYTGANITKATLKLYVDAVTSAGSFNVDYVNGTWTESTIDASNAPALGTTIAASIPLTTKDKNQYILVDVTAAVQAWLNGTPNDGIALVANSPLSATFDSKEATKTSHTAELVIVFAGGGTLTGITTASGSGLTGGGSSGTLNLALTNVCAANQVLQYNGSSWICAAVGTGTVTSVGSGAGLTGGPITGTGTLSIAANACASGNALSALPFTCSPFATLGANTFTGNQTVSGNLSATGLVTGSGYQIGSNLFDFGSYGNGNAFLGFSGNLGVISIAAFNTAIGVQALLNDCNTTCSGAQGAANTASGYQALYSNTTGYFNTAAGDSALYSNTTGDTNTGIGALAGQTVDGTPVTGFNNTALGAFTGFSTGSLTNATAIGDNAIVSESNALVLGSTGKFAVNVGIGTTAPGHLLDVAGTTAVDSTGLNNGTNFIDLTFGLNAGEGMSSSRTAGPNQYGIDLFTDFARRISIEQHGNVGIGTATPDNLLTVNGSADKPGGGSWGTYSDGRLKNLNGSFNSGLSQVLKLNPVRYRYKSDNALGIRDEEEHIGVVAQDVQRVIPEAVTENSKGYLLVNNDPIIWAMLNAIKEQQAEIRTLKSELRTTRQSLQKVQAQVARSQPALVAAK